MGSGVVQKQNGECIEKKTSEMWIFGGRTFKMRLSAATSSKVSSISRMIATGCILYIILKVTLQTFSF